MVMSNSVFCQTDQKDILMDMTMERFGKQNDNHIWWIKDMHGYMDHTHEVRMILATDNIKFQGAYEILSSKQRFFLEGKHTGEQIELYETDSLDHVTGIIKGDMNDDKFYCEWFDQRTNNRMPLFVYHNSPSDNPCGNVGWAQYYKVKSTIIDSIHSISIVKKEAETYMTIGYKNCTKRYELECENDACTILRHLPSSLTEQDEMLINMKNNKIEFRSLEGRNSIDIFPSRKIYLNCKTYYDFDEKFSFLYPLNSDKKFNQYIDNLVVDKYMDVSHHLYQAHEDHSLTERNIHGESGDIHLDLFNDTIVSGVFLFQGSNIYEVTEVPFIYNFDKRKAVDIKDMFVEKYLYKEEMERYVAEVKSKKKDINVDDFHKDTKYDLITLSPAGFKCKTAFNTIYGDDAITIPYEHFKFYYKKKSIFDKWKLPSFLRKSKK